MFQTLHLMFKGFYTEHGQLQTSLPSASALLARLAPDTSALTCIEDSNGLPKAKEMIRELMQGQAAVVRTARAVFSVAEDANDQHH